MFYFSSDNVLISTSSFSSMSEVDGYRVDWRPPPRSLNDDSRRHPSFSIPPNMLSPLPPLPSAIARLHTRGSIPPPVTNLPLPPQPSSSKCFQRPPPQPLNFSSRSVLQRCVRTHIENFDDNDIALPLTRQRFRIDGFTTVSTRVPPCLRCCRPSTCRSLGGGGIDSLSGNFKKSSPWRCDNTLQPRHLQRKRHMYWCVGR